MKAGRELDYLIASKVFGAKVFPRRDTSRPSYALRYKANIALSQPCCAPMDSRMDGEDYYDIPNYSTDIKDAIEVFLKMNQHGIPARISNEGTYISNEGIDKSQWCANFMDGSYGNKYSEELPHAICLAALKAMGVLA